MSAPRWTIYALLLLLECYPFWSVGHFPSQDGPSHLYNACVMAGYGSEPLYREYYVTQLSPAGNLLTQFLLVGLIKVSGAALAEKLLLTLYAVLFALALRYALVPLTPYAGEFGLFAFLFLPNFFLHMGFWNFCYSIPLMLLALGYYLRGRSAVVFGALALLVYASHVMSWVILALAVGFSWGGAVLRSRAPARLAEQGRAGARPRSTAPPHKMLLALLPGAALVLVYALRTHEATTSLPPPLRQRAATLLKLTFLRTVSPSDLAMLKLLAVLLGVLAIAALFLRRGYLWLALSAVCAGLVMFGPDAMGSGSYINGRVALYSALFLVFWLAVQPWPRWVPAAAAGAVCALAVTGLLLRMPAYREWDARLARFENSAQIIRPGSTVLALSLDPLEAIDPMAHALGWLSPRPFIDLRNYEARLPYFPTRFRPQRQPPARTDYVLFYAGGPGRKTPSAPEDFALVREDPALSLRLYEVPSFSLGIKQFRDKTVREVLNP